MRNEPLTGYLLHHKAYKETRELYYFFTPSHGVVHGVGKKGMPLFANMQLFANGKRSLKTMSQIQPLSPQTPITGDNLYAGFYLNELLWKLLGTEDAMPALWQYYQHSINKLREPLDATQLRLLLRCFEQALFVELGYGLSVDFDIEGDPIQAEMHYKFLPDAGFKVYFDAPQLASQNSSFEGQTTIFAGKHLLVINAYLQEDISNIEMSTLQVWSRLHKQMIDHLLDHKPLQSRELWQQQQRYR